MSAHPDRKQLEGLDGLDEAARQECLRHSRGCSACREVLVSEDPSRLFALLVLDPLDPAALDSLSRRVALAIERPARRHSVAAVAASLLLAGLFSTYLWNRHPAAARPAPPAWAAQRPSLGESAGTIEVLSPETAEVLNLQIGDTVLFMIFDEELEL